jgi:hypothetical protein
MQTESSHLYLSTGVSTRTFGTHSSGECGDGASAPVPLLGRYVRRWKFDKLGGHWFEPSTAHLHIRSPCLWGILVDSFGDTLESRFDSRSPFS